MRKNIIQPFAYYVFSFLLFLISFLTLITFLKYNNAGISLTLSLIEISICALFLLSEKILQISTPQSGSVYILSIFHGIISFYIALKYYNMYLLSDDPMYFVHQVIAYIFFIILICFIVIIISLSRLDQKYRFENKVPSHAGLCSVFIFSILMTALSAILVKQFTNIDALVFWMMILPFLCVLYYICTVIYSRIMRKNTP